MISSFSGEFAFLSNFHPARVVFDGVVFPTVEHAFQAAKSTNREDWCFIAALRTAGQAKRAGRKVQLREDWEHIKIDVMTELVFQKFSDPDLRQQLLATGDRELVEGNTWNDRFWGVCKGKGENHLGKILTFVRKHLRDG
jgi:ribA/ribD-fused uncharacterized protein